jgi:hypothetical protein
MSNRVNVFLVSFQIYEGLASSGEPAEKSRLKGLALISYRRSVELDLSQTDLLIKIGELMLNLPIEEHGKARLVLSLIMSCNIKNAEIVVNDIIL